MADENAPFKRPESVLVVVYTDAANVLLLKRADHPNFWQSVTGAMRWDERDPRVAAARELREETGIAVTVDALRDLDLVQRYSILPQWRHRYAPDVIENIEHAFGLQLPAPVALGVHPEHTEYRWLDAGAAATTVASWTNRVAIERVVGELRRP